MRILLCLTAVFLLWSCSSDDNSNSTTPDTPENLSNNDNSGDNNITDPINSLIDCSNQIFQYENRGDCTETLTENSMFSESINAEAQRVISSNNIPSHDVGRFGGGNGSLNPNSIAAQNSNYNISSNPTANTSLTPLLKTSGPGRNGIQFAFGILLNGVELDPIAAEPWPHSSLRGRDPNANWEWNLEALEALPGLDCNNAHVQPNGKYHYHGSPVSYLESIAVPCNAMTLIGYAADGFPMYYKYAYENAQDASSPLIKMTSSYQLKTGERPGNGVTAPTGTHDGTYSNDFEYIANLGTLDEANGRNGVTPEYPNGTYYYIITDDFPSIPRYFRGTPSEDFRIGNN